MLEGTVRIICKSLIWSSPEFTTHLLAKCEKRLRREIRDFSYMVGRMSAIECRILSWANNVPPGTAEGRILQDGEKGLWHLGTYKTLGTSLSDMQIFGKLGGTLTYFANKYLWEQGDRFLSDRELKVRAIRAQPS